MQTFVARGKCRNSFVVVESGPESFVFMSLRVPGNAEHKIGLKCF